jgi:hypothetical protein
VLGLVVSWSALPIFFKRTTNCFYNYSLFVAELKILWFLYFNWVVTLLLLSFTQSISTGATNRCARAASQ